MSLKASKSLANGKVDIHAKLYISTSQYMELLPTISSNSVRLLGCAISFQTEIIDSAISTLLSLINKSNHRGVQITTSSCTLSLMSTIDI